MKDNWNANHVSRKVTLRDAGCAFPFLLTFAWEAISISADGAEAPALAFRQPHLQSRGIICKVGMAPEKTRARRCHRSRMTLLPLAVRLERPSQPC